MKKSDQKQAPAAEFLKAWQEQMTRQMHDPDMIRAMLAAMQTFGAPRHDETADKPAAASDAVHDAIGQLERRIDALERKLAKLSRGDVSVDAKAKKPTRAGERRGPEPVATGKRGVAKKRKPATKRAKKRLY